MNRNKKSIGISFKEKAGVELIQQLAATADILVENYLPQSLKKYGLDFETLRKGNPRLIYASITGYGQTGPYSDRAGYDVMVEAYDTLIKSNRMSPSMLMGHTGRWVSCISQAPGMGPL